MTTVINTPAGNSDSNGGMGFLIGIILLIVLVAVLLYFGIPAIQRMGPVQVNTPATQINVPDKIDVKVTQPAE